MVNMEELDFAFDLKVNAKYKREEFETLSIGPFTLRDDKISLFTSDEGMAKEFNFYKREQFVFIKEVSIQEIEHLIEIQLPILKFKELPISRKVIASNEMIDYIKENMM